jgi:RHS repeat-associated protein
MKRYISIIYIVVCCSASLKTAAQTRTFVQEDVVKVSGVTTGNDVFLLGATGRSTSRTYLDGLGRPIQQVAVGASPLQKDIVQPIAYNNLGQTTKSYLPYASSTKTGFYRTSAISEQATFYTFTGNKHATDTKPYSAQLFDESPLQHLLQAGNVGDGYQPGEHYKTMVNRTNLSSETVRHWNADGSAGTSYAAGTLNVTIATDEEGNETIVYADNSGKTLLKKQYLNEGGVTYVETYYVYDDAGQVVFAIPPKAVKVMQDAGNYALSQTAVDKLIFKYVYDGEGKMIEKTVPGAGTIYMVYDPLDRLVLAQDANMRANNKWNYIKYDSRNVAISQGIYTDVTYTTRSAMQSYVSGLSYSSNYFEERNSSSGTGYYTNVSFPTSNIEPLAYSYFSDYDLDGNGSADFSFATQSLTGEATPAEYIDGMPTMVRKRSVGSGLADIWLTTVMFYDAKGRLLQTQANNHLNSSVASSSTIVTDFTGKTRTLKTIQVTPSNTTTVSVKYHYDHEGRLLQVSEKYNSADSIRIAAYEYNELGQMVDKKLHSTNSGSSYLQSVDYRYNIRGQLVSINNSTLGYGGDDNDDANDVFGMELLYGDADAGVGNTAYYNGALAAVKWKTNSALSGANTNQRSYRFTYDKLMRLKDANYADRSGGGSWGAVGNFDEKDITYDVNGNILTLKRKAVLSGSAVNVDDLSYSYDGNRLDNVSDGSGGSYALFGFKNLTGSGTAYGYDDNGNMTSDAKKGLTLSYNELNRTKRITITTATNRYIDYTYDSGGNLLRKQAYDNSSLVKTTDYISGFTYEDGTLAYFSMSEGRVRNASGTLTNEYLIKDQQGNVRVSFEDNMGTAIVRQENSFYPYGLTMPGSALPSADNKKLYNGGSEWQNDFADLPDLQQTFYRNYDPALGRFVAVDPVSESAESMTTYQYALNNPGMLNDPMGDQVAAIQEQMEQAQAVNFLGGSRRLEGNYNSSVDDMMAENDHRSKIEQLCEAFGIGGGGVEASYDSTYEDGEDGWLQNLLNFFGFGIKSPKSVEEASEQAERRSALMERNAKLDENMKTAEELPVAGGLLKMSKGMSGSFSEKGDPMNVVYGGGQIIFDIFGGGIIKNGVSFASKSLLGHIFQKAAGHVKPTTIESMIRYMKLFDNVASDVKNINPNVLSNYQRANISQGFQGYSYTFRNGQQVWVQTFKGKLFDAGVNKIPIK